ncbi:MAG: type 1 glutamine amidotransferase [Pseudomonadota bacterium]
MTGFLIVEGNTPNMVARGHSGARGFVNTLSALVPEAELRISNPYEGKLNEADLQGMDGIIFTGSGVHWSVDAPDGAAQHDAMEFALSANLPIWGSCNGLQLAMFVLGGAVGASPVGMEVGMARDLAVTEDGAVHPMMAGRVSGFAVPCIHRDEVQVLPDGAMLLAENTHSKVQAVAYECDGIRFWGVQYHPELSLKDIGDYVRGRGIFSTHEGLADDLDDAEEDVSAAARLGTRPDQVVLHQRSLELANWLQFVTNG